MRMQEVLITPTNRPGESNIFQVFNKQNKRFIRQIHRMNHDQDIPKDVEMQLFPLPYELTRIILLKTIYWLLCNKSIQEACQLMFINKDMLHFFHTHLVTLTPLKPFDFVWEHQRLSRTMRLVNIIEDIFEGQFHHGEEYFCLSCTVQNPNYTLGSDEVEPLDLYNVDSGMSILVQDMPKPIIQQFDCFQAIKTGPLFLDVAYLMGYQGSRYFRCSAIKRPIFVFLVEDFFGASISPKINGYHYFAWVAFAKLLRIIYGPCTGVYLTMIENVEIGAGMITMEIKEIL